MAYTVMIILESRQDSVEQLKQLLISIVDPSRRESTCLEYRLHQSITNPAQFVLYERWESKEAHQQQFQKPYILALGENIGQFLAGPYQVILAEEV